ncbi:MAG: right-handed parallel beta-helix repeat-containing protein [Planctomycetota bacterium]
MSTRTNLPVAFLLCMVLCVSPASGKVLKVPSEHPTIDAAISVASEGDTILIARGTYEHTILNVNKRLTLASDYVNTKDQIDIDETIIKATPAAEKQWFALHSRDSRIVGLTIIGNENHTLKITSPYSEVLYCNFIGGGDQLSFEGGGGRVAHCDFDGAGDDAVDADDSVNYVVEYCTFDNVKEDADETRLQPKSGPLTTHVFRYNTVLKAGQSGIQLVDYAGDSKRTFHIYGNLFLNCKGSGVSMMANEHSDENHEGSDMVENVIVYNNTFYGCNHGITLSPKAIVLNNIFSNCQRGVGKGRYITRHNDKTLLDYCLFFKNQTDYDSDIATGLNILKEDPHFKNTKTFELSEVSPAVDAGTAKYAEVLNIPEGAYNGSAPDLGARELAKRP